MKHLRFLSVTIFCSMATLAFALPFNYTRQWEKIAALEAKSLPQSALQSVDSLIKAAKTEKNSPQLLKGWLFRFRYLTAKSADNFAPELQAMENYTTKTTNNSEKAMLHSLLAELYLQYYQQDSYTINQRTKVTGFVPSDMKEWTVNIFADTIVAHAMASLKDADLLQKTNVLVYESIIEAGKDSRILQPTLYDFLEKRAIEILSTFSENEQIDNSHFTDNSLFGNVEEFTQKNINSNTFKGRIANIYKNWLSFRLKEKNIAALIYNDMQRLEFIKNNTISSAKEGLYLGCLKQMHQKYMANGAVVEVLAAEANYYIQHDNYDKQKPDETAQYLDFKKRAYDLCAEGIRRFPKYARINSLKELQQQITTRNINIDNPDITAKESLVQVKLGTSNIKQLELKVYRINSSALEYYKKQNDRYRNQISKNASLIETRIIPIKASPLFRETDTTITIKPNSYGIYEYSVQETGNTKKDNLVTSHFSISDLAYFTRTRRDLRSEICVVNRITGKPLKGIPINLFTPSAYSDQRKYVKVEGTITDQNGFSNFSTKDVYGTFVQIENNEDIYFPFNSISTYFNPNYQAEKTEPTVSLFTDRSIYRPGQTLYYKGIAWIANKKQSQTIENKEYSITLIDANYQEIAKQTVKTNEFGSFAGNFVLTKKGLNGNYSLKIDNQTSLSFSVEEYKRPSFEIKFDPIKGTPAFGDKVTVTGNVRSYADYPIAKAAVKYRIVKRPHWLMRWFGGQEQEISNGQTISDEKGKFNVEFVPQKTEEVSSEFQQIYTYSVLAEVTDSNGETQKNEISLSIGDVSMYINADCKEEMDKAQPFNVAVTANNLNGEIIKAKIEYRIFKLKESGEYAEAITSSKPLEIEKEVTHGSIENEDKLTVKEIAKWMSGSYLIRFRAKDDKNRPVETEKKFTLYSTTDSKPPVKRYRWIKEVKTSCKVGENAEILFGTSAKDAYVLYELLDGMKVLESKWIPFNNENRHFSIPFKEEYEGGITLQLTLVKDERYFSESIAIRRKQKDTSLTPKFSVFRDKLLPGQKEEWKITIPELQNEKKRAECMVGMYDASLDIYRTNKWSFFGKYYYKILQAPIWNKQLGNPINNQASYNRFNVEPQSEFLLDKIDIENMTPVRTKKSNRREIATNEVFTIVEEMPTFRDASSAKSIQFENEGAKTVQAKAPIQIRTNFNETAFFYPQLRTDEKGEVSVSFTAPESLTRWNVMGLAHTKDLYFGQWEAQTVTQKPFMVQPNLPRFIRESDKLVIAAKLMNLSEKIQSGTAKLELIDPNTNTSLSIPQPTLSFSVEKDGNAIVSWDVEGFQGLDMLICKITAFTEEFSDGEQHYLPVLPDKIRITETLPIRVHGNQTKQYNFDNLLQNGDKVDNKSLTVEMTPNPAWYAVQALPSLIMPTSENAISWFCAYYSNTLAAAISRSNPKIATIFAQWQQSSDALKSPLNKNEELKNILLTETPWVMEAKNESDQKQRIGQLFDTNVQSENRRQAIEKLTALQLPNGGFAWFAGMTESRFITQFILEGMARLEKSGGEKCNTQEKLMQQKALKYADECMSEDFVWLKRYNKEWAKITTLSSDQLYYFYIRSFYKEIPTIKSAVDAVNFYHKLLPANWKSLSLFGQALTAITAQRDGNKKLATDIVKSLLEHATSSDEKGLFWDTNRSGMWWHESNILTHTAILEAIDEITGNSQQTDDMKLWLLSQKQTERWHSPIASVEAIQALLEKGSDWLSGENNLSIKLGNETVKTENKEAGTDYSKTVYHNTEVHSEMGKVTVTNLEPHPAWGALYWQYETTLDNTTAQNGLLNVNKKLFIERNSPNGLVLQPITGNSPLNVGDKVTIRLTIKTDRDMEFVALTDQRAACLEPTEQLSGCHWKERLCYYQSTKDASTQFFFSFLPKGTYVFEYTSWVTRKGTYSNGIATIQCQYAPEFSAHSAGEKIIIK